MVVISEKEKQAKIKEAEIVTARSQILKLESKLTSMEHSNKRARLEFDRELESIQSEQSVRILVVYSFASMIIWCFFNSFHFNRKYLL